MTEITRDRGMAALPEDLLGGRTVVVAGGTGAVGRVAVAAFLAGGARVVVPSRSSAKLAALVESVEGRDPAGPGTGSPRPSSDRLLTLEGDLSDEADGPRLRREIEDRAGPVHGVVATLGRFVPAPSVLGASASDLRRVLDGYLTAHFMVAKALLPAVDRPGGSYTFINGPLAFEPMYPGTGLVSVATAGQAMLARTVMKEWADRPVRINEVVLHTHFPHGDEPARGGRVSRGEVGAFLAWLASEAASEVRGRTIQLDRRELLDDLATTAATG